MPTQTLGTKARIHKIVVFTNFIVNNCFKKQSSYASLFHNITQAANKTQASCTPFPWKQSSRSIFATFAKREIQYLPSTNYKQQAFFNYYNFNNFLTFRINFSYVQNITFPNRKIKQTLLNQTSHSKKIKKIKTAKFFQIA